MSTVLGGRGFLRSERMQIAVREMLASIGSQGCVLISGEPGAGRQAVARAIHLASTGSAATPLENLLRSDRTDTRFDAPFVVVDCATSRDVEQQVFGRIAPAGGQRDLDRLSSEAALCQAFGGTLFLRSVQEIPARVQARLARVMRDGEVWIAGPDGDPALARINVRVIASIDPSLEPDDQRLVPELWKRLAAHRIELPPIRQRREDIPGLVRIQLAEICDSLKIPAKAASSQAMAVMAALPWRGNFTEMRGLLRALVLKVPGRLIRLTDLLENIRLDGGAASFVTGGTLKEARERFEREYVAAVLEQHHGRMAGAARALGIQRTNLYRKLRQLSVARKRPKGGE